MRKRSGFTIIEVSLFLAITALLFVGITVGTQNSINQQRYADSVNSFADFLRNIYSEVSNPQSKGHGNSEDLAIYGKLITFGESYNLSGENNNKNEIFVYDVLGSATGSYDNSEIGKELKKIKATVFGKIINQSNSQQISYGLAGMSESFLPKWDSSIENKTYGQKKTGSILIVRHPRSGTITTLVSNTKLEINDKLKPFYSGSTIVLDSAGGCASSSTCGYGTALETFEKNMINGWENFKSGEVVFCVNPFGDSGTRQAVKMAKGARNASGVVVIDRDGEENASLCPAK